MFGYAESEIIGQRGRHPVHARRPRAKGEPAREIQQARDEGRADNERWHARKDGSIFYGSGSVMPLRDKAGGLRGFVKIMRDLTESKRTQEALREHMDELHPLQRRGRGPRSAHDRTEEGNQRPLRLDWANPVAIAREPSRMKTAGACT